MNDDVILVDEKDNEVGFMNKLETHQKGLLHRAFSILIFNSKNELLLQKRSMHKYHSGGLWSNSCCSHPKPGEALTNAASRRLQEELGLNCSLNFAFSFKYKIKFINGLTEHEFDHVFIGQTDDTPKINKMEIDDWKYAKCEHILSDMETNPDEYTEWFKICIQKLQGHLMKPYLN